jgi:hypothetical protein
MPYPEIKDEIKFDLFQLHDKVVDNTPTKWICANSKEIWTELSKYIMEAANANGTSRRQLSRLIAKNLKISVVTANTLVYPGREWIPLIFIEEILKIAKKSDEKFIINDKIVHLKVSSPPLKIVKAPKKLTIELCKIMGSHTADGTLGKGYYFHISDGDRGNLKAFQKWLKIEFNLEYKVSKVDGSNEWEIGFHSKIFSRYLIKFFHFPEGKKCDTTGMPEVIQRSNAEFRKAFAIGAMSFESGLGAARDVSLCVLSKKFRDDLAEVVKECNIPFVVLDRPSLTYWRFWSERLSNESAQRWIQLFEPNTEKWHKLQEYSFGYKGKVSSFEEAVAAIEKVYPKLSANKVTTNEVLMVIKRFNETHRYEIVEALRNEKNLLTYGGKWAHSLRHHLDVLKDMNMILVHKERFGPKKSFGTIVREVYRFNPNVKEWAVPKRESLEEIN